MRSYVRSALSDARDKSVGMFTRGPIGPGDAVNPVFGGGMGGTDLGGSPWRMPTLQHHQEQYRHYTGWVFSSIRPIAQAVARQPLRLARIPKNPSLIGASAGPVTAKSHLYTPYGPISKKHAGRQMYFRKFLPKPFKQYYETAELIQSHPLLDAINDPNELMVRWSLMYVTICSLELTGKCFWWIRAEPDTTKRLGYRIVIWPLPSHWVAPKHTSDRLFSAWQVRPEGTTEPIIVPLEQIVYFPVPDPSNPFGTFATLQAQARAVVCDESISESQRQAFARGIFPGYAVIVGRLPDASGEPGAGERPTLSKEQRHQLLTSIKQVYRGVYNSDEPLILDQLIQDVKRITNTNREMDWLQSGQTTKEKITQAFGVNPIIMGQVEGANRASSATAEDHLNNLAVNPKIELISECLTAWLGPIFSTDNEQLVAFIEEAHASDPDSDRADWALLASNYATSRNELRAGVRGLPPLEDGDSIMVPAGMIAFDVSDSPPNALGGEPPADKPPGFRHVSRTDDHSTASVPVVIVGQTDDYDCGAASTRSVADMYGMCKGWKEADFMAVLDTEATIGTQPEDIVAFFRHHGCEVRFRDDMTPEDLWRSLRAGRPMICLIQGLTWGTETDRDEYQNGHWVVVCGLTVDRVKYMDPWTASLEEATWKDWLRNWRDRDNDGRQFERFGISVGPPPKRHIIFDGSTEQPDDVTPVSRRTKPTVKGSACYAKLMTVEQRVKAWTDLMTEEEAEIARSMRGFLDAERERIKKELSDWLKRTWDTWQTMFPVAAPESLNDLRQYGDYAVCSAADEFEGTAEQIMSAIIPLRSTTRRMVEAVEPALNEAVLSGARREWEDLKPRDERDIQLWTAGRKPKPDRTPLPKEIGDDCRDYLAHMVQEPYWEDMTRTTRFQMAREIRRGLAHGETREQIERRVLAVLGPETNETRAALIARTEATGAVNVGQQAARNHLEDLGLVSGKQWEATFHNTRPSHAKANGQKVKAGRKFRLGNIWCDYPGDQTLPAEERCNCQCTALTIPA